MSHWSFYERATGRLTGAYFSGSPSMLEANTPEGCDAIEGQHDHLCQRVDLESSIVVEWQPPAPGEDHEWDATSKRWGPSKRSVEHQVVLAAIAALEAQQGRAVRELILDPLDPYPKSKLRTTDAAIAELRKKL